MASAKRVSLFPILLVNFIGTLGSSIVLPFLVTLVARFGGNALVYGAMGATYSAFQLVGAPILGRWSDVQGRRKILLMSQLGTLASWFVFLGALFLPATTLLEVDSRLVGSFVLTLPLVVLFLARGLDGLTGGNVSVANAYLADVTDEGERNVNFGKMAVAGNLGFILGADARGVARGDCVRRSDTGVGGSSHLPSGSLCHRRSPAGVKPLRFGGEPRADKHS